MSAEKKINYILTKYDTGELSGIIDGHMDGSTKADVFLFYKDGSLMYAGEKHNAFYAGPGVIFYPTTGQLMIVDPKIEEQIKELNHITPTPALIINQDNTVRYHGKPKESEEITKSTQKNITEFLQTLHDKSCNSRLKQFLTSLIEKIHSASITDDDTLQLKEGMDTNHFADIINLSTIYKSSSATPQVGAADIALGP